jgi:hypothetical protein
MNSIKLLVALGVLISLNCIYSMKVSTQCKKENDCFEKLKEEYEKETLQNLKLGNLEAFDALVGDTACQIRALYIAMLYDKLQATQATITKEELNFATLSFMLTKAKHVEYSSTGTIETETVNYKYLDANLSKKVGCGLIKKAQTELSALSVLFLQHEADIDTGLQKALSTVLIDSDIFKRSIVACYPSVKLVLLCAALKGIPLIIKLTRPCSECSKKLHTICFFYRPKEGTFTSCAPDQNDLQRAALVCEGFCSSQETCKEFQDFCLKFKKYSIVDIILANAAVHPQYPGKDNKDKTVEVAELQKELQVYRDFAQTNGCCKGNPALFCLDHILCKTVKQALTM